ncbi:MAG: Gfo/Idh/MocA family oxidoreductase [Tepidisphaeraceae bacterium]
MDKLRLIQCGVGGMGKAWRDNATSNSPDFEIVAVVDPAEQVLDEAGEQLGVPPERRFKDLRDALNVASADGVLTVTPPSVHVEHAKLTFANGLHLLTEKPIADNLENAKRMVKLAANAGKQLVVAQNYRFSAAMETLKRVIAEKPVGAIGHGHLDFYIAADFTGSFRETMPFPLLVDMAIHHLDLIRAMTGRNIAKVTAQSFKPSWSWYQHHPGLKMLMALDDGTPFSYSGDWSALGRQTGWNGTWRLQCADGSIHLEKDKLAVARCERWGKDFSEAPVEVSPTTLNGQARLLADFAAAIRSGKPAETSGADNLWSFAAVIAGVTSATEGRTVDVADAKL